MLQPDARDRADEGGKPDKRGRVPVHMVESEKENTPASAVIPIAASEVPVATLGP